MYFLFTIFGTLKTHTVIQWDREGMVLKEFLNTKKRSWHWPWVTRGRRSSLALGAVLGRAAHDNHVNYGEKGSNIGAQGDLLFPAPCNFNGNNDASKGRESSPNEEGWRDWDKLVMYSIFELPSVWKKNVIPYNSLLFGFFLFLRENLTFLFRWLLTKTCGKKSFPVNRPHFP